MKKLKTKGKIAAGAAGVALFLAADHFAHIAATALVPDISSAIRCACNGFWASFVPFREGSFLIGASAAGIGAGLLAVLLALAVYAEIFWKGTFRRGEEHGSARWADTDEVRAYTDFEHPNNNMIVSRDVALRAVGANDFEHKLNRNVIVLGGSGSGKTFGYIKPNLMQIPAAENANVFERAGKASLADPDGMEQFARSFFVTDSKGITRVETGYLFADHGYNVLEFNVIDFFSSRHFNVFRYIHNTDDVLSFATCLINNTKGEGEQSGEDFWIKSERLFYQFLGTYMLTEVAEEERNFNTFCALLDLAQVDDNGEMSGLDILVYELEHGCRYAPMAAGREKTRAANPLADISSDRAGAGDIWDYSDPSLKPKPDHPAVIAYRSFKSGATETLQSILISCKVRVAPLRSEGVMDILADDEMELDKLGDRKTVVYCVFNDQDDTFNFLIALMIWIMLKQLYLRCSTKYAFTGGSLPVGVDLLLDEAANFYVPGLEKTVSTCRSRNIGISIILQSKAQLKARYGDSADTIIDCCDTLVFLGGKSTETNKMLEEMLGQQTVTTDNRSQSKGGQGSMTETIAQHGRALMQSNEIGKMSKKDSLVLIQGANPWFGPKTDPTSLPMWPWVDPGRKGALYSRGFDYFAYKCNPRYYAHEAAVETSVRVSVSEFEPLSQNSFSRRAFTAVNWYVSFTNTGDSIAYDILYNAELSCVCTSNEAMRIRGKPLPFPAFDDAATTWRCVEAFSSRREGPSEANGWEARDPLRFIDSSREYAFEGVNLDPGETFSLKFSMEIGTEELLEALGDGTAEFEFVWDVSASCANADVVLASRRDTVVADRSGCRLAKEAVP